MVKGIILPNLAPTRYHKTFENFSYSILLLRVVYSGYATMHTRRCKPWWECSLLRDFEVSIRCLGQSNLMGGTGTWIQGCETHIKRCYEDETAGSTPLTPITTHSAMAFSSVYIYTSAAVALVALLYKWAYLNVSHHIEQLECFIPHYWRI